MKRYIIALVVFILSLYLTISVKSSNSSEVKQLLSKYSINEELKTILSERDKIFLAMYITYNHCENIEPHTGKANIKELFTTCRTACGGYVYIFKEILNFFNINTRYSYLFNIPNQGTHVVVEAKINNKWEMYDPTFGTFFSSTNEIKDEILSLEEINFKSNIESLRNNVFVVNKSVSDIKRIIQLRNYKELFTKIFDFKYMTIENYLLSENIHFIENDYADIIFNAEIDMKDDKNIFGINFEGDLEKSREKFLNFTNELLNNDNQNDDVSYYFHRLGLNETFKLNASISLNLKNLTPNELYSIKLSGFSKKPNKIQMTDIGKNIKLKYINYLNIDKGEFTISNEFKTKKDEALIQIRSMYEDQVVNFFKIEINKIN
jgi:hypothetical protein